MPRFTTIEIIKTNHSVCRHFLNQNTCGTTTFGITISSQAQLYGPSARFIKWNCSFGLPLYQAMKNSIAYA